MLTPTRNALGMLNSNIGCPAEVAMYLSTIFNHKGGYLGRDYEKQGYVNEAFPSQVA